MSVEAMTWALKQNVVTDPGARFVLVGLANHAHADGRHAFPSLDTLAEYTGLSRRSVIRKLQMLEEAGIIHRGNQAIAAAHIERADRRPTVYDLVMIERGDNEAPGEERGDNETPTGCQPVMNGVSSVQERGVTVTPETSSKPKPEPSIKPNGVELPEWLPIEPWRDFVEHRQKIKAKMTVRAMQLAIKELGKLRQNGHDPAAVLEQSVLNGWKGVFPLKGVPANDNRPRLNDLPTDYQSGLNGSDGDYRL